MNLKTFEMELQAWLDGFNPQLSAEAQQFMQQNRAAQKLYSELRTIKTAAGKLIDAELKPRAIGAIKKNVWHALQPENRWSDKYTRPAVLLNWPRTASMASALAACIFMIVWLWPSGQPTSVEQEYAFYLEEHHMASGDLLAAEIVLSDLK
ncbi:MAG: hypothetical protein DWQ05_17605 [Calditrichaeota bacterium]|nr:MAG: hypothetical protein DWQ05_17605 [Calditrichota bacterium]